MSSDVLITGFGAAEFELRVDDTGPTTTFGWTAPADATEVICALFVAEPDVVPGPPARVRNGSKSIYRTHTFRIGDIPADRAPPTVEFSVDGLSTPLPSQCQIASALEDLASFPPDYPVVTTLQVGCWAYDTKDVIGATRLRNLKLSDLPEVAPPVTECSSTTAASQDGRLCLLASQVGVCVSHQCLADAGSSAPLDAGATTSSSDSTPVADCADASDETLCRRMPSEFRFGRCVGNRCADQSIQRADLPVVTADCALPGTVPTESGAPSTDWLNCFDGRVQGYGTCYQTVCRLRCVSDDDCAKLADFTQADAGSLKCAKQDGQGGLVCQGSERLVGICVPEVGPCH